MIRPMRLLTLAACLALPLAAAANPNGSTVTSGSATLSSSGSTLTVTTGSAGTIINWNSFSIGSGETTRFVQPSSASVTLNRVTGPGSSSILGTLQSNGQIFLTNPNGIVIGSGAQVDVAGFVASTLDISDADFLAGHYHFTGSTGSIVNNGSIIASDAYVALLAPSIQSSGSITTGPGGIALVASDAATLTVSGSALVNAVGGTGSGTIDVQGTLTSTGMIFIVTTNIGLGGGITGCPLGSGGCGVPLPPPPILVVTGNLPLQGTLTTTGSVSTGTTITAGSLTSTTTAGAVTLQGNPGNAPAVAGAALNLEKREVSF